MTSDLLKNIDFIDILTRGVKNPNSSVLSIKNHTTLKADELYSYGHHPWFLDQYSNDIERDSLVIGHPNCLAIGETGLDRVHLKHSLEEQLKSFRKHVHLSEKIGKPLIIHCVKAYSDILKIYHEARPKQTWILHDFNNNEQFLKSIEDKNIYISLGRNFFERQNSKINKSLSSIDISKVLFETDEMENSVVEIYNKFSLDYKIEIEELCEHVKDNFSNSFLS